MTLDAHRSAVFIGEIGDRITVTGTVRFAKILDGNCGEFTMLIIDTKKGVVKWLAPGDHLDEQGEDIVIRVSVKAHESFNDHAVTVVTRGGI